MGADATRSAEGRVEDTPVAGHSIKLGSVSTIIVSRISAYARSTAASYSLTALSLNPTTERSVVYEGTVDGRIMRVYVLEGSQPPVVKTAAWKDE
jgi:hypothetical protein